MALTRDLLAFSFKASPKPLSLAAFTLVLQVGTIELIFPFSEGNLREIKDLSAHKGHVNSVQR